MGVSKRYAHPLPKCLFVRLINVCRCGIIQIGERWVKNSFPSRVIIYVACKSKLAVDIRTCAPQHTTSADVANIVAANSHKGAVCRVKIIFAVSNTGSDYAPIVEPIIGSRCNLVCVKILSNNGAPVVFAPTGGVTQYV